MNEHVTIAVVIANKDFGASTGFEPGASTFVLQCSTNLACVAGARVLWGTRWKYE